MDDKGQKTIVGNTEYDTWCSEWEKCRDAYLGQSMVHKKTTKYLPRLSESEDDTEYENRLMRSTFLGATEKTINSLVGFMYNGGVSLKGHDKIDSWAKNVDMQNTALKSFSQEITEEVLKVGRGGVLVDMPSIDTNRTYTKKEMKELDLKPYLIQYKAEHIVDWYEREVNGTFKLVYVKLAESYDDVEDDDYFNRKDSIRYRELILDDEGYYQKLSSNENSDEKNYILINGKKINYIPFVFFNAQNNKSDISKPPLIDMVNINFDYYRTQSDYKHALFWAGNPTPFASGVTEDEYKSITIGPKKVIGFSSDQAKLSYLSVDSSVFKDFREELEKLQNNMAVLGSRALIPDRTQSETAEALMIKSAGEQAGLSRIADSISNGFELIIKIICDWSGIAEECVFRINKEFISKDITPLMLAELYKNLQAGVISKETMFNALKKAKAIDDDIDFDNELIKISKDVDNDFGILYETKNDVINKVES